MASLMVDTGRSLLASAPRKIKTQEAFQAAAEQALPDEQRPKPRPTRAGSSGQGSMER